MRRIVQRGNDVLSSDYPWTSFGLTIHGNIRKYAVFPQDERMQFDAVGQIINRVNAKSKSLISCASNGSCRYESTVFVDLKMEFIGCKLMFTPAQVVEGINKKVFE